MPVTSKGLVYPGPLDKVGNINGLFATFAQSIDDALPQNNVTSLSQLAALTAVPEGALATNTGYGDGLDRSSIFVRENDKWILASSPLLYNRDMFISAINNYPSIRTWPGGTFYDGLTGDFGVWKNVNGGWWKLSRSIAGKGSFTGGVKRGKTRRFAIKFPAGAFTAKPTAIIASTNYAALNIAITKWQSTGFELVLSNWSPYNTDDQVGYSWVATA